MGGRRRRRPCRSRSRQRRIAPLARARAARRAGRRTTAARSRQLARAAAAAPRWSSRSSGSRGIEPQPLEIGGGRGLRRSGGAGAAGRELGSRPPAAAWPRDRSARQRRRRVEVGSDHRARSGDPDQRVHAAAGQSPIVPVGVEKVVRHESRVVRRAARERPVATRAIALARQGRRRRRRARPPSGWISADPRRAPRASHRGCSGDSPSRSCRSRRPSPSSTSSDAVDHLGGVAVPAGSGCVERGRTGAHRRAGRSHSSTTGGHACARGGAGRQKPHERPDRQRAESGGTAIRRATATVERQRRARRTTAWPPGGSPRPLVARAQDDSGAAVAGAARVVHERPRERPAPRWRPGRLPPDVR